jgi:biotin transport system substrate-specific component
MSRSAAQLLIGNDRVVHAVRNIAIVIGASFFVALCARITLPLPFTPVPLTLQNFGVLLVGSLLGARRGFAALAVYLAEGMMGLPVFSPIGPGGMAQLIGPTGGFLLAYPFVAGLAGLIMESGRRSFVRAASAAFAAEIVLFAGGVSWLFILTHSVAQALRFGLYWFIFAEIMKIMLAAAVASGWGRFHRVQK